MKILYILLLVAFPAISQPYVRLEPFDINDYLPSKEKILEADTLLKEKNYAMAFPLVLELAKKGDVFSQYTVSVMFHKGLGTPENIRKAYAWAFLSSRYKNKHFVDNFNQIKNSLPEQQLDEAEQERQLIFSEYNNVRIGQKIKQKMKMSLPKCTGSRIRGSSIACVPSGITCSISSGRSATKDFGKECLLEAAKRNPTYITSIRNNLNVMNKYIEEEKKRLGKVIVTQQ